MFVYTPSLLPLPAQGEKFGTVKCPMSIVSLSSWFPSCPLPSDLQAKWVVKSRSSECSCLKNGVLCAGRLSPHSLRANTITIKNIQWASRCVRPDDVQRISLVWSLLSSSLKFRGQTTTVMSALMEEFRAEWKLLMGTPALVVLGGRGEVRTCQDWIIYTTVEPFLIKNFFKLHLKNRVSISKSRLGSSLCSHYYSHFVLLILKEAKHFFHRSLRLFWALGTVPAMSVGEPLSKLRSEEYTGVNSVNQVWSVL